MTHRVLVPLMLIALSGFGPHASHATVRVTLEEAVDNSDVIARVRVHAVRTAEYTYDGESHSCGQVYSGEVREAIKGSSSPIEFLSLNSISFEGVDRDYLIFAIEAHRESEEQLMAIEFPSLSQDEQIRQLQLCQIRAAHFSIEFEQGDWFPLGASSPRDTDSVLVARRPLFKGCPSVGESHFDRDSGAPLIRWQCARQAIEDQLRR